jgi:hypothetical protein
MDKKSLCVHICYVLRDETATICSIAQKRHLEGTMPSSVPPGWIKTGRIKLPEKYIQGRSSAYIFQIVVFL